MKGSSMFSDYWVGSSVNRSVNHSPTSGTIHKQRSSFGPKITLVNRSRDQSSFKDQGRDTEASNQYIEKILMLSLEISRLNNMNESIRNTHKMAQSSHLEAATNRETEHLKDTNNSLKVAIKTVEEALATSEEEKNRISSDLKNQISDYEIENRNLRWKVSSLEDEVDKLSRQNQRLKIDSEKNRMEKSKMEMSRIQMSQHTELQRSLEEEKNKQISSLNSKINRHQSLIDDQKFKIERLEYALEQQKVKETQLMFANRELEDEFEKINQKINYELKNSSTNTERTVYDQDVVNQLKSTINGLHNQKEKLSEQLYQKSQKIHVLSSTLHSKESTIEDLSQKIASKQSHIGELSKKLDRKQDYIGQLRDNNASLRQQNSALQGRYHNQENSMMSKTLKIEESYKVQLGQKQSTIDDLSQKIEKLVLEIDLLKQIISEQNTTIELRSKEQKETFMKLNEELASKDKTLRKLERKQKEIERINSRETLNDHYVQSPYLSNDYAKLFKSRSIDSTSVLTSQKNLKDMSLDHIVTEVTSLQGSNQRSLRLIDKSREKARFQKRTRGSGLSERSPNMKDERRVLTKMEKSRKSSALENENVEIIDYYGHQ